MRKIGVTLVAVAVLSLGLTACDKTTGVCEDDNLSTMSLTSGKSGGSTGGRSGSRRGSVSKPGSSKGKPGSTKPKRKYKHHDHDDCDD
jgi:hypothetical protein